jgi:hypothetical protein
VLRKIKRFLFDSAQDLTRFEDRRYEAWRAANPNTNDMASLGLVGRHRRFLVTRMGSTGSTWFAKLLNSSPEVYCSHELVVQNVFPRRTFDNADIQRMIAMIATDDMHGAYDAVGDVGSIFMWHLDYVKGFKTGILVRHPARLLHTRLAVYPQDQSFSEVPKETHRAAAELWGIDMAGLGPQDQIFIHDAYVFSSQLWAIERAQLIRIEDMSVPELCLPVLHDLTGVEYSAEAVRHALSKRVNQRTKSKPIEQILEGFSPAQLSWYRLILGNVAPHLGYDLENDRLPSSE